MAVTAAVNQQIGEILAILKANMSTCNDTNTFQTLKDISVDSFAGLYIQVWYAGGQPDFELGDSVGGSCIMHRWKLGISVRFTLVTDMYQKYVKQSQDLQETVTGIMNLLHNQYDTLFAEPPFWSGTEEATVSKQTQGDKAYVYEAAQKLTFKMLAIDPYVNYKQAGGE